MKKFELALETEKVIFGVKMFRIKALISFSYVKEGDLGGYVEAEKNLSQDGNAWVYGNARVYGDAWVYGNAWVYGDARVYGNARVAKYGQCVVINNQRYNITLTPNLITIGCKSWKSLANFKKTYKKVGKDHGYTADETKTTLKLVSAVMTRLEKG